MILNNPRLEYVKQVFTHVMVCVQRFQRYANVIMTFGIVFLVMERISANSGYSFTNKQYLIALVLFCPVVLLIGHLDIKAKLLEKEQKLLTEHNPLVTEILSILKNDRK